MIFGNPDEFAIHCDIVDEWNDDYFWVNGIYNIYIKGEPCLRDLYTTDLKFNLANINTELINNLAESLNKENAFRISSSEMEDNRLVICYYFDYRNDYISINYNSKEKKFSFPSCYVKNILLKIAKWKESSLLFN